ncbi:MAG: SDR family NAD(P)-dependent oxidoreductase [Mycobacterium sp.]
MVCHRSLTWARTGNCPPSTRQRRRRGRHCARPPAVEAALSGYGDRLLPLRLDVSDDAQVQDAVAETIGRFGQIDVLVNNAGRGLVGAVEETAVARLGAVDGLLSTQPLLFGPGGQRLPRGLAHRQHGE